MIVREYLLFTQEIQDRPVELGTLLHLGPVAALVKDVELHSWCFFDCVVGMIDGNDLVLGLPHYEHWDVDVL